MVAFLGLAAEAAMTGSQIASIVAMFIVSAGPLCGCAPPPVVTADPEPLHTDAVVSHPEPTMTAPMVLQGKIAKPGLPAARRKGSPGSRGVSTHRLSSRKRVSDPQTWHLRGAIFEEPEREPKG
jgi:hypothetical protein